MATATQARRSLVCPMGCEYSATPGDYWNLPDGHVFCCEHDGWEFPNALVEYRYMSGKTADGKEFYGSVRVVLTEEATVADLSRKEF